VKVAVLGAGAGGAAAVAELSLAGHEVSLWNRSAGTLAPFADGVSFEGVLGEGRVRPAVMSVELAEVLAGADVAVVTLPTTSHGDVARALVAAGWGGPVVLNPGHTGGALEFVACGVRDVAEFSTLTYVARVLRPGCVTVTGAAKQVRMGWLRGGEDAAAAGEVLYPAALRVSDVLASGLANINMVLHAPGAVLGAAWVEATGGDFTFYVQGMTPGVARVMALLDAERLAVASAFGVDLPGVVGEMQAIGTVARDAPAEMGAAIASGGANKRLRAPDGLAHRYYREDFGHGVLPFLELAVIAGVEVPVASALFVMAEGMIGPGLRAGGRTAGVMGIAGMSRPALLDFVGHG
jgi:opine dehydrogenase